MTRTEITTELDSLCEHLKTTGQPEDLALAGVLYSVMGAFEGGSIFEMLSHTREFIKQDIVRLEGIQAAAKASWPDDLG